MQLKLQSVRPASPTASHTDLQRQLDADQHRWSRQLREATDAAFDGDELNAFRMTGLYGQIPDTDRPPLRMPRS